MCWLALNVIKRRRTNRVSYADGGVLELQIARSAHSNAVDYIPIALILMFLLEQTSCSRLVIHLFGVVFLIGRLIHAKSILSEDFAGRVLGMRVTIFTIIGLAATNLVYFVIERI